MKDDAMQISEYEEAILRLVQNQSPSKEDIIEQFKGTLTKSQVKILTKALLDRGYIKTEKQLAAGLYSYDLQIDNSDYEDVYVLAPLGDNYLSRTTANSTLYNNISNSNIAHLSPYAQQKINLSELPDDLRKKISELELAIARKDHGALKASFAYIADKSVDVAIAILLGGIGR